MKKHLFSLAAAFALSASAARAESQWRVPVHFAYTNDAGMGNFYFVVGSHPDIGFERRQDEEGIWRDYWNVLKAIPLAWHPGDVWSADVGIQAGTELEYKFIKRSTAANQVADSGNVVWEDGNNHEISVPAEANAPYSGKRVVFLCNWDEPVEFCYSMLSTPDFESTNAWTNVVMKKTGDGRYEVDGVGEPGEWMRFTFHQTGNDWWYHFRPTDDVETDFWTPLDAFCVRDGQVFDYEPVPTSGGYVSASRIVSTNLGSTYDGIAGRDIRIYLPRGYDENTARRYPVVYFSDGQNVFQPGGTYGCWNAEIAADREIRAGHMREAILVAVPCRETAVPIQGATADTGRLWEYLPSTDYLMGTSLKGLGANYAEFLSDNVKNTLDTHFRTLKDRENTVHIGSSAGGLLSLYLGTVYGSVFGLVAPMSGVYNEEYIPQFRQWCQDHPEAVALPKRIWLDTGTEETDVETLNLYASNWDALTLLLYAGHVPNKSLHFGVYSGDAGKHNEPAWAARIADVFDFLLPVTDEFNPLLPIELKLQDGAIAYPLYPDTANELVHLDSLLPLHTNKVTSLGAPTDKPWDAGTFVPEDAGFYFIRAKGSH